METAFRRQSAAVRHPRLPSLVNHAAWLPLTLQDDTFFPCTAGRLKLRDFLNGTGELIFYRRDDERGPKQSFYVRCPTFSPDSLRESLSLAYGQLGRLTKHRTLFLIGRTRVHLDDVSNLGTFLELEVVLQDDESPERGVREATELMRALNIGAEQLVDCAYIDLLAEKHKMLSTLPENAPTAD